METITSRQNPLCIHLRKLAASAAYRRQRGEFLCDSPKLLKEALLWGAEIRTVVTTEGTALPELPLGVRQVTVPADVMKSVSPMETPQGALFVCAMRSVPLPETLEGRYALRIRGGISSLSRGAADIRRCYLEARTAVQVAEQSESQRLVSYHEATFELAVQSIPGSICRDLGSVVFSGCTEPEREQFSQLIRTYYQQCGSINQCAEALYIHRNTVQYRMQQLREKSGYDLRHPKEALLLYLAVRDALPASEAEEA